MQAQGAGQGGGGWGSSMFFPSAVASVAGFSRLHLQRRRTSKNLKHPHSFACWLFVRHKVDYDEWHAAVHGSLDYEKYLKVGEHGMACAAERWWAQLGAFWAAAAAATWALLPGQAEAWEQHGVLEPASAHLASPRTAPHTAPLVTLPLPIRSPTPRCARCCSPSLCPSTSSPTPTVGTQSAAWSCWAYATALPPSSALRTSWRRQSR